VHSDADGNLAVVSVLLEEGSANPLVETLWGLAPKTPGPEKTDVHRRRQLGSYSRRL
jgi:carbonic anhydrase